MSCRSVREQDKLRRTANATASSVSLNIVSWATSCLLFHSSSGNGSVEATLFGRRGNFDSPAFNNSCWAPLAPNRQVRGLTSTPLST
jgi:hypothetical protein